MSSDAPNSDQVSQDSRALRSAMENVLERITDDQAAEAFRQELHQITDRGAEHTRQVYDDVANQVGSSNLIRNNALVTKNGTLCLYLGDTRSLFTSGRDVCAYRDGSTAIGNGSRVRFRLRNDR